MPMAPSHPLWSNLQATERSWCVLPRFQQRQRKMFLTKGKRAVIFILFGGSIGIYNYIYTLGPFLASFMVSSSRVCRTIWTPHKIPMGLSRTILLCDKNPLKIIRNYMRNTKNTIKHMWNYLQNQTKSLGTIWKTHKIPRGLCWNSLRHGGGYMTYVFTFAQNRKFLIFFRGTTLK